ncbi:MAG: hypothetical protein HFJ17_03165 [Clostridia bacterium]|nr:hypothetical protein [Clostridia bacterium]
MKKLLMLILIVLLVALSVFIVTTGVEAEGIEVLSYMGIRDKNLELDGKIQEASKLAEKDFKQAINTVQESSKNLEKTKKEYEEMTAVSDQGDIQAATQIQRYEIETLWVKLGNYATSEGITVKLEIVQGNTSGSYNLKFTVSGSYVGITDYISDIENDSTLGFKIEEFKMTPTGSGVQALFTCKEIAIKEISGSSINSSSNQMTAADMGNTPNTSNSMGGTENNTTTDTNTTNNSMSPNTEQNSTNTIGTMSDTNSMQ